MPSGTIETDLASIGLTGGITGRSMAAIVPRPPAQGGDSDLFTRRPRGDVVTARPGEPQWLPKEGLPGRRHARSDVAASWGAWEPGAAAADMDRPRPARPGRPRATLAAARGALGPPPAVPAAARGPTAKFGRRLQLVLVVEDVGDAGVLEHRADGGGDDVGDRQNDDLVQDRKSVV